MPEFAYNSNPHSYQHLLSAGVSLQQIRQAINSGLNPAQLPPEYFGMSGGYSPQSVGPGATHQSGIGGIDIPPANMGDPYGYTFPNPQMNQGGNDISNWMQNTPYFGYPIPSSGGMGGQPTVETPTQSGFQWDYSGFGNEIPQQNYGGAFGSNAGGFQWDYSPNMSSSIPSSFYDNNWNTSYGSGDPSGAGFAGSGMFPYSEPSPIPFSDPSSMNLSDFPNSTGMQLNVDPSLSGSGIEYGAPSWLATNSWTDPSTGETHYYDANWNWQYSSGTPPQTGGTPQTQQQQSGNSPPTPQGFTYGGSGPMSTWHDYAMANMASPTGVYAPHGGVFSNMQGSAHQGAGPAFTGFGGPTWGGFYDLSSSGGNPTQGLLTSTSLGAQTGGYMPIGFGGSAGSSALHASRYV